MDVNVHCVVLANFTKELEDFESYRGWDDELQEKFEAHLEASGPLTQLSFQGDNLAEVGCKLSEVEQVIQDLKHRIQAAFEFIL